MVREKWKRKWAYYFSCWSYKLSWADVSSIMRNLRGVKKEKKKNNSLDWAILDFGSFSKRKNEKEAELITCLVKAMNLGSWGQS